MFTDFERKEIILGATHKADLLLEELQIDSGQQIPIFDIVAEEFIEEITLDYQDFSSQSKILGVYAPANPNGEAKILIHRRIPLFLQRFTLAHELGHYMMEHATHCTEKEEDGESSSQKTSPSQTREELEAQAFAAAFLMPLQLIHTSLERRKLLTESRRIKHERFTAESAYQLALEMGVNYTAVITHLSSINRITGALANQLSKQTPKIIKERLLQGQPLLDPWADVWQFDSRDTTRGFTPRQGDLVRLDVPTAYSAVPAWSVTSINQNPYGDEGATLMKLLTSFPGLSSEGDNITHFLWETKQPGHVMLQAIPPIGSREKPIIIKLNIQYLHPVD